MGVVITIVPGGIIFDATGLPGAGTAFARKYFRPINTVNFISLFNDRVIASSVLSEDFNLTIIPTQNSYPVKSINGVPMTTLEEIYTHLTTAVSNASKL